MLLLFASSLQYDCFDCQKNTFAVNGKSSAVDVDFSMVAKRAGKGEITSPLHMKENMDFDDATFRAEGGKMLKSRRTAHTEGRMFGLTFWENWYASAYVHPHPSIPRSLTLCSFCRYPCLWDGYRYVIGENKAGEEPFKFVYYTGKTLQNTYSGAFVYARTPYVPEASMAAIQKVARDAGMDPTKVRIVFLDPYCPPRFFFLTTLCRCVCQFCRIRNGCFAGSEAPSEAAPQMSSPSTLSVAAAATVGQLAQGDAVGAYDARRFTTSIDIPWKLKLQESWYEQPALNEHRENESARARADDSNSTFARPAGTTSSTTLKTHTKLRAGCLTSNNKWCGRLWNHGHQRNIDVWHSRFLSFLVL